jgi:bacillithiol biosynthesis cysteine-adding enzyme BshC
MNFTAEKIAYESTGFFSRIVLDYINADEKLQPFYAHPVAIKGIKAAIEARKQFNTDRILLHGELVKQYSSLSITDKVKDNLDKLLQPNTFTITTAHQPNIFTGHLYFIYKILHVVKVAADLKEQLPENDFVPVFYMGSEDADLEELGHIYINGEKYEWQTNQTGAVGRMKVDKALVQLIDDLSGQLTVYPYGETIVALMKDCYQLGITIEQATLKMVNSLFGEFGLIVLLPDNAALKKAFNPIVAKELDEQFSHKAVAETVADFPETYKVQASGREVNLFYLKDDKRERIEIQGSKYKVQNLKLEFDSEQINAELNDHPERFSANVILRPVFQEMILPNIVFIGGGGEIAYWLELKKVFDTAQVPYPLMLVRNSFMVVSKETKALADKLQFSFTDLFKPTKTLLNILVKRDSKVVLTLKQQQEQLNALYTEIKSIAGKVDTTLWPHTEALQIQASKRIAILEKKMLKAEKKKFDAQQRQLQKLKAQLFPHNSLQERIENFMLFYAKYGTDFMNAVYQHSNALKQDFAVIEEQ